MVYGVAATDLLSHAMVIFKVIVVINRLLLWGEFSNSSNYIGETVEIFSRIVLSFVITMDVGCPICMSIAVGPFCMLCV